MPPEEPGQKAAASEAQWPEEEPLGPEAGGPEQQMVQLRAAIARLTSRLRHQEEALDAISTQVSAVVQGQQEVRHLETVVAELQATQQQSAAAAEEMVRRQDAMDEYLRGERVDMASTIEELQRRVNAVQDRQANFEELWRRYQERVSEVSAQVSTIEQSLDGVQDRVSRNTEGVNRLTQRESELNAATANAERAVDIATEKMRVLTEAIRRVETDSAVLVKRMNELSEISDQLDLSRAERTRLESRFAEMEETVSTLLASRDEHQVLIAALEGKHHGYEGRLDGLVERLNEYRENLADHLAKLSRAQAQLKRRQIGELTREIKELEQHALDVFQE
jgi:chromosome segregation ATPase